MKTYNVPSELLQERRTNEFNLSATLDSYEVRELSVRQFVKYLKQGKISPPTLLVDLDMQSV